jgi:predicted O-methyltransferase YrrM
MQDTTNLRPPAMVADIASAADAIGFTISSDALTGSLLRTLATSKPSGMLLELGTGVGMGTAWLLDGMDAASKLITVDRNTETTAVAKRFFGHDPRVTFQFADGAAFIQSSREQGLSFDLIFADMFPGKFSLLDETLSLLKKGGLYVVDDLLPSSSWPQEHQEHQSNVDHLIAALENRSDLRITKLNWSVGLVIAAKV